MNILEWWYELLNVIQPHNSDKDISTFLSMYVLFFEN